MEKYPTVLNILCPITGCNAKNCIDTSGRKVNFFSCKNYHSTSNDVYCNNTTYDKYYRLLGSVYTDSSGDALLTFTVTSDDLTDYNDAIGGGVGGVGGNFNIVACIDDPLAMNAHAVNFGNIIVTGAAYNSWYMEWDFNSVPIPIDFINAVSGAITTISNSLGPYIIPYLSNGIIYDHAEFVNSKFRIYVNVPNTLGLGLSYLPIANLTTASDILLGIAAAISLVILVWLVGILISAAISGVGISISIPLALAALTIVWATVMVVEVTTGAFTSTNVPTNTTHDKIATVNDFVTTHLTITCNNTNPTCATDPPTCNATTMRLYLTCMNSAYISQCTYNQAQVGSSFTCSCTTLINWAKTYDTGLANGTITPADAKAGSKTNIWDVSVTCTSTALTTTKCPNGYWDATKQACVSTCWIPSPIGGCILPAGVGEVILLLIGGYVVLKATKII